MNTNEQVVQLPTKSKLPIIKKSIRKNKVDSHVIAERVVWMSRTSDVLGSHIHNDLESYLTLIRRKIQEKCSSTQDLIYHIRRNKISDKIHVTPNEFRYTLIKFGITLPQTLVDKVFSVFDSDRSGTMDFDEFAMWIMNSEFRPKLKKDIKIKSNYSLDILNKFRSLVNQSPHAFSLVKSQLNYMEFLSEINRLDSNITDSEARAMFILFDKYNTGVVDSDRIIYWIKSGQLVDKVNEDRNYNSSTNQSQSLAECIIKVAGRTTKHIDRCFNHIPIGQNIKISFDEFRSCLLAGGMGKNVDDVQALFNAIGSGSNAIDIDILRRAFAPMPYDLVDEVSAKREISSTIRSSRADRHLRESLRKSYPQIRNELESLDINNTGLIKAEDLYRVLVKQCMPLTFQDFRFILQQLITEDGESKVDWKFFLKVYNPIQAPHILDNLTDIKRSISNKTIDFNQNNSNDQLNNDSNLSNTNTSINTITYNEFDRTDSNKIRPSTASAIIRSSNTLDNNNYIYNQLKKLWQVVLRECHRADYDRTGFVKKVFFIEALNTANTDKSMSHESIVKLADHYSTIDGQVDYLACFRDHLTNDSNYKSTTNLSTNLTSTSNKFKLPASPILPIKLRAVDIKRDIHSAHPSNKISTNLTNKSLNQNTESLLSNYPPSALHICSKCYVVFLPVWRDLHNDFKKGQIVNTKGHIYNHAFIAILKHYSIHLSNVEIGTLIRTFRSMIVSDAIRYDEFLRVCLLVKDSSL